MAQQHRESRLTVHIVERVICLALLTECVDVSLGNTTSQNPSWTQFWIITTVCTGVVFAAQTLRETKGTNMTNYFSNLFAFLKGLVTPAHLATLVQDVRTLITVVGVGVSDLVLVQSQLPPDWKVTGFIGSAVAGLTLLARDLSNIVNVVSPGSKK